MEINSRTFSIVLMTISTMPKATRERLMTHSQIASGFSTCEKEREVRSENDSKEEETYLAQKDAWLLDTRTVASSKVALPSTTLDDDEDEEIEEEVDAMSAEPRPPAPTSFVPRPLADVRTSPPCCCVPSSARSQLG